MNAAAPVIALNVASIVVDPALTAVVTPFEPGVLLTVAIDGSSVVHVTNVVRSCVALSCNVPIAVNCLVVPGAMLAGFAVDTVITETNDEERTVDPVMPLRTADMTAVPLVEPAVTSPFEPAKLLTDAMVGSEVLQTADAVTSAVVLFEYIPLAESWRAVPGAMLGLAGRSVTDLNDAGGNGGGGLDTPHAASKRDSSVPTIARLGLIFITGCPEEIDTTF